MLSRIAEAMFWIGRYVERAEATSRMLIEHHQLLVEDTRLDPAVGVEAMLKALSLMPEDADQSSLTPSALVSIVAGRPAHRQTILGSVEAARENARTIREVLPAGMFERMNATHQRMQSGISTVIPGIPLSGLLDELAVVRGIIDWQMSRDEGLVFLRLGAALERLDMNSRLLAIGHEDLWPQAGAVTALRAAGGFNPFLRTQRAVTGGQVHAFLLLDPVFPRSTLQASIRAERAVRQMGTYVSRTQTSALLRIVGILRADLEFASASPTPADLELLTERASEAAFEASDAVSGAFFRQAGTIVWSH